MQRRIFEKIRQSNGSFLLAIFTSLSRIIVLMSLFEISQWVVKFFTVAFMLVATLFTDSLEER